MSEADSDEIEGFLAAHEPFEEAAAFKRNDRIGDWTVLAFLGRGATSEVYRAENSVTRQVGAVKVLMRGDDTAQERFRREIALLADTGCAALPRFYGAGKHCGRSFLATELLEPADLPSYDAAIARFLLGVCDGVAELHSRGYVHRDIKPRNVMRRPATGEPVLIDLGLAKAAEGSKEALADTLSVVDGHAVGVGTVGYSAPEQFVGGTVGAAADIHALGILANTCFKGHPPRAWSKIIRGSTSSIPEQRYATIAEFVRAVRHRHAAPWLLTIIAIILFFLAFFSYRFWGQSPRERLEHPQERSLIGDRPPMNGASPSEKVKGAKSAQESSDKPLTKKEFDEALLNATYDIFYSSDTNIDRKTAIELMRKGMLPSY